MSRNNHEPIKVNIYRRLRERAGSELDSENKKIAYITPLNFRISQINIMVKIIL